MQEPRARSIDLTRDEWPDPVNGVEWICAVSAAGFLSIYFYFGSGQADGGASCWADSKSKVRMSAEDPKNKEEFIDGEHDVGESFRLSFRILFILTILKVGAWTGNHLKTDNLSIRQFCLHCAYLVTALFVVAWWMMFFTRLSHAGKVCSGDYLSTTDSTKGYLTDSGDFILFSLYLLKGTLVILACFGYGYFVFVSRFSRLTYREGYSYILMAVTAFFLFVQWWVITQLPGLGPIVMFVIIMLYIIDIADGKGHMDGSLYHAGAHWSGHGTGGLSGWGQTARH